MKKILLIGYKDLTLAFRDRAALYLMLLAPFVLTIGLGFVSGRFSDGGSSGLNNIPIMLVNQDDGELGDILVEIFHSVDLAELVTPQVLSDPLEAYNLIVEDQAAAAIIIPPGYTRDVFPDSNASDPGDGVQIEIITNPARPTSAGVILTIVESFVDQVELSNIAAEVTITGMLEQGLITPDPDTLQTIGMAVGEQMAANNFDQASIQIDTENAGGDVGEFDVLAYMAPGMALMFLMYTVSYGGRSILMERAIGTLPRLLVTPTNTVQILAGKVLGIYLSGVAQVAILIAASTLLFRLHWGDTAGLTAIVLAAVFGATGWGMLITAIAKTPGQVNSYGSAMMLIFGILGGSFMPLNNLPQWVQWVSRITPNSWGLDGFTTLALGGQLNDLWPSISALLMMGIALFGLAAILFRRQSILS